VLGDVPVCDRCFDARISAATGWPRLPEPPQPEVITGPDRRRHRIGYRIWRSPGGIVVEAEEISRVRDGYAAKLVEDHEADVPRMVERVRAEIRRRIGRLDVKRNPYRDGWIMTGDQVRGRLVWIDGEATYGVSVDGRLLTWEELGLALEPFEGWELDLRVVSGLGDEAEGELERQVLKLAVEAFGLRRDEQVH
jgi:hypothetical protein